MAAMPRLSGPSELSPAARLACGDFPTKTFRRLLVRFFARRDGAGEEVEPGRSGSSPPRSRADPRTGLRWNGRALDATHFRLVRLGGAAFIVLAALTLGAPVQAQVATFVTNYGQVDLSDQAETSTTTTSRAQQFAAGSHAAGYLLDGIDMTVTTQSGGTATYSAYLCAVGTDGFPLVTQANLSRATSCVSLTKPTTGNKYTPPANTYLASGRTYSIIATKTGGTGRVIVTTSLGRTPKMQLLPRAGASGIHTIGGAAEAGSGGKHLLLRMSRSASSTARFVSLSRVRREAHRPTRP